MATTHKYRTVLYALLLLLPLALASPIVAKGPVQDPLRERLDFLKEKLERYASHAIEDEEGAEAGNITFEAVSFETCKVTWRTSTESGHGANVPPRMRDLKIVNQVTVNLSSIDARRTRIRVEEAMKQRNISWSLALELYARAGSTGFTQEMVVTKPDQVLRSPVQRAPQAVFLFNLRDQNIAEDVAKAFADAAAICRARAQRPR